MTGFELQMLGFRSDRSTNRATTTVQDPIQFLCYFFKKRCATLGLFSFSFTFVSSTLYDLNSYRWSRQSTLTTSSSLEAFLMRFEPGTFGLTVSAPGAIVAVRNFKICYLLRRSTFVHFMLTSIHVYGLTIHCKDSKQVFLIETTTCVVPGHQQQVSMTFC